MDYIFPAIIFVKFPKSNGVLMRDICVTTDQFFLACTIVVSRVYMTRSPSARVGGVTMVEWLDNGQWWTEKWGRCEREPFHGFVRNRLRVVVGR